MDEREIHQYTRRVRRLKTTDAPPLLGGVVFIVGVTIAVAPIVFIAFAFVLIPALIMAGLFALTVALMLLTGLMTSSVVIISMKVIEITANAWKTLTGRYPSWYHSGVLDVTVKVDRKPPA